MRVGTKFAYRANMATHGENSRLTWPEWRLYANFLHRELARLWYGKKSVFTLVKGNDENEEFWELFSLILAMTFQRFGLAHGLTSDEIAKSAKSANKEYDKLRSLGFHLGSPIRECVWLIRQILGDKLASEFLFDFQITEIVLLAIGAYGYAAEGKMPPYVKKGSRIYPIEFYEGLPVAPELEEQFYGKNVSPK